MKQGDLIMKISTKILALTAVMWHTYFGAFAMDGVGPQEVAGVARSSDMDDTNEEADGINIGDVEYSRYDFKLDKKNSKFAYIAPKEWKEGEGASSGNETHRYGMDAIEKEVERVYPNESLYTNYVPMIRWDLGGPDRLDRVTIHDRGDYYKYVTYGLTELYDKESKDQTKSGFGMEFTFKLKKDTYKDEEGELKNVVGVLQTLAKATIVDGEIFKPYEYIYTGQTEVMDTEQKSNIIGFITVPDTEFQSLVTPYGRVDFLALIGITAEELQAIRNKEITVQELYEKLGTDVTSYNRKSVI